MAGEIVSIQLETGKLDYLLRSVPLKAEQVLDKAAVDIVNTAKTSMKGGGNPHVPSEPGEPPHIDTGALVNSVSVSKPASLTRDIQDGVEYGIWLECGTSQMAPRPWLLPAVNKHKENIEKAWRKLFE